MSEQCNIHTNYSGIHSHSTGLLFGTEAPKKKKKENKKRKKTRGANAQMTHIQVQNWNKLHKLCLLGHVHSFLALASQPIRRPPAWHSPDVNCPLHVQSLCIHISRSVYIYLAQVHPTTSMSFGLHGKSRSNSYSGRTKCWHYRSLIFGLNSMRSIIMWHHWACHAQVKANV